MIIIQLKSGPKNIEGQYFKLGRCYFKLCNAQNTIEVDTLQENPSIEILPSEIAFEPTFGLTPLPCSKEEFEKNYQHVKAIIEAMAISPIEKKEPNYTFKTAEDCQRFLAGLGAWTREQFYVTTKEPNVAYYKHGVGGISLKPSAKEWVKKFQDEGLLIINK